MIDHHTNKLDIIGGGYECLFYLTSIGLRQLKESPLILYPARVLPEDIRRINKSAELIPYSSEKNILNTSRLLRERCPVAAILLEDGVAGKELLYEMSALKSNDISYEYYPTIPLWQAACHKVGFYPSGEEKVISMDHYEGPAEPAAGLPREIINDVHGLVIIASAGSISVSGVIKKPLLSQFEIVEVVAFDGRVLWPGRVLPLAELPSFASYLPSVGKVFIISRRRAGINQSPSGLRGRGVLVTRNREQAYEIGALLIARGATPIYFPTISIRDPDDWSDVDRAIKSLKDFDGLILTSVNAVEKFIARVIDMGYDTRILAGCSILAVGSKTADALSKAGLRPDGIPVDFSAEGLIDLLEGQGVKGKRFLLPRAAVGRNILPEKIKELGGEIEVVTLYNTVKASPDSSELSLLHQAGIIDAAIFTSGSTFKYFIEIMGPDEAEKILSRTVLACIGSVTEDIVRKAGYEVAVVPSRYTVEDLVSSLETYFEGSANHDN